VTVLPAGMPAASRRTARHADDAAAPDNLRLQFDRIIVDTPAALARRHSR
jgi:hypothetical protein